MEAELSDHSESTGTVRPVSQRSPERADLGGVVWSRHDHPVALDTDKTAAKHLFAALREKLDGLPLTMLIHARSCDDPLPFATTLRDEGLVAETDDLWVVPVRGGHKGGVIDIGAGFLEIDAEDRQGLDLYHQGFLDVVVLTGDEHPDTLPDDLFVGRASVVVIEAVGPHSGELVDRLRGTDALVFLSYPWPSGSAAARTLWQAFMAHRDTKSLTACLAHINNQPDKAHEFDHVVSTLKAALRNDPDSSARLVEQFRGRFGNDSADKLERELAGAT